MIMNGGGGGIAEKVSVVPMCCWCYKKKNSKRNIEMKERERERNQEKRERKMMLASCVSLHEAIVIEQTTDMQVDTHMLLFEKCHIIT